MWRDQTISMPLLLMLALLLLNCMYKKSVPLFDYYRDIPTKTMPSYSGKVGFVSMKIVGRSSPLPFFRHRLIVPLVIWQASSSTSSLRVRVTKGECLLVN